MLLHPQIFMKALSFVEQCKSALNCEKAYKLSFRSFAKRKWKFFAFLLSKAKERALLVIQVSLELILICKLFLTPETNRILCNA